MTVACVVQARMGSTRLPWKVLMDLGGRPMLAFLLERLAGADVDALVVATSALPADDPVADVATTAGAQVIRGPESDVLARYCLVLEAVPSDHVVRITADCPLMDPALVSAIAAHHRQTKSDYTSNTLIRTFPDGFDIEVVRSTTLQTAGVESKDSVEREHVTPFVYRRPERFRLAGFRGAQLLGDERCTVDTAEDLVRIREVLARLAPLRNFTWDDVVRVTGFRREPPVGVVHLRPATGGDADFLLALRNDPVAIAFSRSAAQVSAEEHAAWFASHIDNPGTRMWICEVDGEPLGQLRIEVTSGIGEVSIALDPACRGRGVGRAALAELKRTLQADAQVVSLVAYVHPANVASIRLFRAAGFVQVPAQGKFLRLECAQPRSIVGQL